MSGIAALKTWKQKRCTGIICLHFRISCMYVTQMLVQPFNPFIYSVRDVAGYFERCMERGQSQRTPTDIRHHDGY